MWYGRALRHRVGRHEQKQHRHILCPRFNGSQWGQPQRESSLSLSTANQNRPNERSCQSLAAGSRV